MLPAVRYGPAVARSLLGLRGVVLTHRTRACCGGQVNIGGKQCYVNYSRSQEINRGARVAAAARGAGGAGGGAALAHHGENVLLCSINNPIYPITVEVMHTIMSPYGAVNRVVIFTKRGVQAMVEFADPTHAARAQAALDGKEIYDGCCQLKIVFSRNDKLNVRENNERTFDFTNPSMPVGRHPEGPAGGQAFASNQYGGGGGSHGGYGGGSHGGYGGGSHGGYGGAPDHHRAPPSGGYGAPPPARGRDDYRRDGGGYGAGGAGAGGGGYGAPAPPPRYNDGGASSYGAAAQNAVVIAFNIPSAMGVMGVFNLFGLYGNIMKIKTMPAKRAALVQFEAPVQANGAISHLNRVPVMDAVLDVQFSKHPYIAEGRHHGEGGAEGEGGETRDFQGSLLNRFKRAEHFRHIYHPTTVLHFANCPPDFDERRLREHFTSHGGPAPTDIKFFAPRPGDERPRRLGLMEFANAKDATDAVVVGNNVEVDGFTVRLAFSQNSLRKDR